MDNISIDNMALENMAKESYRINKQIKELTERYSELMDNLKNAAGGRDARFGDYKLCLTVLSGSVDYSEIPELKTINLDLYRKPGVLVYKLNLLGED